MSKQKTITELLEGIDISTFEKPKPEETIIANISLDKYDLDFCSKFIKILQEAFPDNNCMVVPNGVTLESRMGDDLK